MGLASALTTALTGLSAAETQVDVIGNNLANSQTVGFKESRTLFSTQFLQTLSVGSTPTDGNGGTNPRQTGLGTRVAEISPRFTQGTVEVSSNPSDLAIQGDGFFIVENSNGERLYTRNGIFKTNSENQLVTQSGNRVLGFGVNDSYEVQTSSLVPLSIPLGSAAVAQATQNVFLQGVLSPSGDVATTAGVIQSAVLGDSSVPRPDVSASTISVSPVPSVSTINPTNSEGTGTHPEGATYKYRFTYVDAHGTESVASSEISVTTPAGNTLADNSISLTLPSVGTEYSQVKIYRTAAGGSNFFALATAPAGSTYVDNNSVPLSTTPLNTTNLSGNYTYLVTYARNGEEESRPSVLLGPQNVSNSRIHLQNLPTPPVPGVGDSFPAYDKVRIYRNLAGDSSQFYLVSELNPGEDYTDSRTDAEISDLNVTGNKQIDLDGPKIDTNTLLVNVVRRNNLDFENVFTPGTLEFAARKGERSLAPKSFTITNTSTVQDLLTFMKDAMGIQTALDDPQHPIPTSLNNISGETTPLSAGLYIKDGKIRAVSNNGVDNSVAIDLSAFKITSSTGAVSTPNLGFGSVQTAKGQSAVADFVAYDTLGIPVNVRITSVLESVTDSATVYRWYADSSSNSPTSGADISVGTGLITFDGRGNFVAATNDRVTIERRNIPSSDPLEFKIDFGSVTGLAQDKSTLAVTRQDGSAAGTLSNFVIGEDGVIQGVFSSGVSRSLGQIRMARFANPNGLTQRGDNNFSQGVNSGLPIENNPGQDGTGKVIAGAVELSNSDVGKNLIDLVTASTQYRSNARVITTVQQLLDELLNLRR